MSDILFHEILISSNFYLHQLSFNGALKMQKYQFIGFCILRVNYVIIAANKKRTKEVLMI